MSAFAIKRGWVAGGVCLAVVLTAAWAGLRYAEGYFLARAAEQSQSTLRLSVDGLRGVLSRYEPLPALIAARPDIMLLLASPAEQRLVEVLNRRLKKLAATVEASDIYVLDTTGTTITASNFDTETSFVGRNFSFRPYFKDAVAGGLGRYFALGTTSLKRGYYFASPVRVGDRIVGAVTVKINVDSFEDAWRGSSSEIIVVDDRGIIFMSSRDDWLFSSLQPLSRDTIESINRSQQYPADKLKPFGQVARDLSGRGLRLVSIPDEAGSEEYIAQSALMPAAGWTVQVLSATTSAKTQAFVTAFAGLLIVLIAALASAFLLQRRARFVERLEAQREAQLLLEKRVEERTADLNAVNIKLLKEIDEHAAAEAELRKTQADLVQAGKLAALGQMSAALSHEFNQPLSAVRSYADNAAAYLDRDRTGEARENITRISQLIDRMAAISKHLRNFARKPQEKTGPVPLATVINDAIEILSGKLKMRSTTVSVNLPSEELWVRGGQVRLQQVLVNLISNALDATADVDRPSPVEVKAAMRDQWVEIRVRDHGPGVAGDVAGQIFDPFFTTKGEGKGLGLGLSISYNIIKDFGGNLKAENHPDGGAVFVVELQSAQHHAEDAAE